MTYDRVVIMLERKRQELIQGIKTVSNGQPFIGSAIASRLALAKINPQSHALFGQLRNKEKT